MALNTITQLKLPNGKVINLVDWTDTPLFSTADFQSGFTIQDISLFNYTTGGSVPGAGNPAGPAVVQRTATENDTNLAAQGSMASTEEMLVYSIRPETHFYVTDTQNDFTSRRYTGLYGFTPDLGTPPLLPGGIDQWYSVLNQQLLLRFYISQKVFSEAGLGYYNTGFGPFSASAVANASAGVPAQDAVRSFVIPQHLGSQEKFRVDLVNVASINDGAVDFGLNLNDVGGAPENSLIPELAATIRIYLDGLYKRPTA